MDRPRMDKSSLVRRTLAQLRAIARGLSFTPPAKMRKSEIIRMILEKADQPAVAETAPPPARTSPVTRPSAAPDPYADLPAGYGANRVVALPRDPVWIFTYWEATPEGSADGHQRLGDPYARLTLRVYDLTSQENLSAFFDIEVYHRIGSWYIDVGQGGRTYQVDVGLKSSKGSFATLARSNIVSTPAGRISDDLSEEWWIVDDGEAAGRFSGEAGRRLPQETLAEQARAELLQRSSSEFPTRHSKQWGQG